MDTPESPKIVESSPAPISDMDPGRVPGAPSADPAGSETQTPESAQQPDITGNALTGHAVTLLDLLWLGVTDPTRPNHPS